jgi:two-component sensor histidine kinase
VQDLLNLASFMPHGYCLFWNPWLIGLHVFSDLLIALSYFAIPGALILFLRRRPDLRYRRLVALFAAFILLCGMTHLGSLATLWLPAYTAEGALKLMTGVVSATTAVVLFNLVPKLIAIPSPHELDAANQRLRAEIAAHEQTLTRLREAQRTLEDRVEERTRDLSAATQKLSVLSREAVHRSRNLLTVVSSIARQTARGARSVEDFVSAFLGRMSALATATAAVMEGSGSACVSMERLIGRQLQTILLSFSDRVHVNGPETELTAPAAQQLALVLHELATNAQKHGALSRDKGDVRIGWSLEGPAAARRFVLDWRETGGTAGDRGALSGGFGSELILRIAPGTLGGQAEASFAGGFRYRLDVPADRVLPKDGGDGAEDLSLRVGDDAWRLA